MQIHFLSLQTIFKSLFLRDYTLIYFSLFFFFSLFPVHGIDEKYDRIRKICFKEDSFDANRVIFEK